MIEALSFEFMRNALLAGLLASLVCGVVGTFVVVNRIVFVSGGIAHAAYGGVGLAFFLGLAPLAGILGFTLAVALVMAAVTLKAKHRADTVIGVLWAVGMALGVILVDLTPGYKADLMSYLFGSILAVPASMLWMMLGVAVLVLLYTGYFYYDLAAMSYDEEFAIIRGIPVKPLYYGLTVLIALSVVMLIQVVGLILVIRPADHCPVHRRTLFRVHARHDGLIHRAQRPVRLRRPVAFIHLRPDLGRLHHHGGRGLLLCVANRGTAVAASFRPGSGKGLTHDFQTCHLQRQWNTRPPWSCAGLAGSQPAGRLVPAGNKMPGRGFPDGRF